MNYDALKQTIYNTILELATEDGINASGKGDVYGCIFGRDSAVSILKILKACSNKDGLTTEERANLLAISKRGLQTLVNLQGKQTNIESGEEPGKFIHEYRPNNYERLLTLDAKPWYVYPEGVLRNYDSIDSTPLSLIALYRYWEVTQDAEFLFSVLPAVEQGLNWIITYGDKDKDFLLEYELPAERQHGGLVVQSWTDSKESMMDKDGKFPFYPIAPVEVQGYAWLALKLWADFYADKRNFSNSKKFANKLRTHAKKLKEQFNKMFIFKDAGQYYAAQALDGLKNQITTVTGNPLLLLWATYRKGKKTETILHDAYISDIVGRAFADDMFDADAGIRTMSTKALTYVPGENSYHNGSFWPKLNGMAHEGLILNGYTNEASQLKDATLKPIMYFNDPIELYVKTDDGTYMLYKNEQGQESCKQQAWSAAVALDLLTY